MKKNTNREMSGTIRFLLTVACAMVLILAMGITAFATAEPGTTIYIEEGRTNVTVRSQPSTDSDPVGTLNGGAALVVVSVTSAGNHNWYQVECVINGQTKTGYVRDDLVEIPEAAPVEGNGEDTNVTDNPNGGTDTDNAEGGADAPAPQTPGMTTGGIESLTPMEYSQVPENLPEGFVDATISINDVSSPAFQSETREYYLFYAVDANGNADWYLYDSKTGGYIRYADFLGSAPDAESVSGNGQGVSKAAFTIVIVLCVILVVVTAVMGIKLMNGGRDDYDYDDDDEDEDDYDDRGRGAKKESLFRKLGRTLSDDDDDYEDEDEDEEVYEQPRRQAPRQTHQVVVQQRNPQGQARPVAPQGQVRPGVPQGQTRPMPPQGQGGQQRYAQRQGSGQSYAQRPVQR